MSERIEPTIQAEATRTGRYSSDDDQSERAERRNRYAAGMAWANEAGPEWAYEWHSEAEAAMAEADIEIAAVRAEYESVLREEKRRADEAIARETALEEEANNYAIELGEALAENNQLRRALENSRVAGREAAKALFRIIREQDEKLGAVQAVLDEWAGTDWGYARPTNKVRAALKGES